MDRDEDEEDEAPVEDVKKIQGRMRSLWAAPAPAAAAAAPAVAAAAAAAAAALLLLLPTIVGAPHPLCCGAAVGGEHLLLLFPVHTTTPLPFSPPHHHHTHTHASLPQTSLPVRRMKLEEWVNEPFFEETLPGCMVSACLLVVGRRCMVPATL